MGVIRNVEICRPGTWKGVQITMEKMQRFLERNNFKEFASVIAHPARTLKKVGKNIAGSMRIVGDALIQDVDEAPEWFMQGVKEGYFPARSIRFDPKTDDIEHTGWLPSGIPPAVEGLAPVKISHQDFSILEDFESDDSDTVYIEFTKQEINMDELKELEAKFEAKFVQFQAETKAENDALKAELAKVKANVAEKPTEFSAYVDSWVAKDRIFEHQKAALLALDPFKPVDFSSDDDKTAYLKNLDKLTESWSTDIDFMATPKGKDMMEDEEDEEMKKAIELKAEQTRNAYKKKK